MERGEEGPEGEKDRGMEGDENIFAVTISVSSDGKSDCTLDLKIVMAEKV